MNQSKKRYGIVLAALVGIIGGGWFLSTNHTYANLDAYLQNYAALWSQPTRGLPEFSPQQKTALLNAFLASTAVTKASAATNNTVAVATNKQQTTTSSPTQTNTTTSAPSQPTATVQPSSTTTVTSSPAPTPTTQTAQTVQVAQPTVTPVQTTSASSLQVIQVPTQPSSQPTSQPAAPSSQPPASTDPLSGKQLYVNPYSNAKSQADAWRTYYAEGTTLMDKIANQATAVWFGNWNSNIYQDVKNVVEQASNSGKTPVLVAYNIPQRDCGSYSAGGSGNPDGYKQWIDSFAAGIGNHNSIVVLEPDGLAGSNCLSTTDQNTRFSLISYAVKSLKQNNQTYVYIDAGHPGWASADDMASRLRQSGIDRADGFALNVSNFISTNDNITYGQAISQRIGNKHFVIDTSRNGNGPASDGEWCNPWGRGLGQQPTTNTGNSLVDAYLWVKAPGESDGQCNGGPSAGTWWLDYAMDLARHAAF